MVSLGLVASAYHGKLREISKLGVDLTVGVPPYWGSQKIEDVQPNGYKMSIIEARFAGPMWGKHAHHFHYYPAVSRLIQSNRWDIIHIDEEPFNLGTYHILKSRKRKASKVVFFTWQNLMKRYPPPFNLFEKTVFRSADGAIAGNEEALRILRCRGFSKEATTIPQFGVDPVAFCKRDEPVLRKDLRTHGDFVIGYVGRFVREKGVDTLVRSLSLIPDAVLTLVGSGPDRPRLEALIAELRVGQRVRWVAHVNSTELPKYMNAIDVLALPSRTCPHWKEQFGRVLIEAMACETCVVGSNSGEIPNVVGDAGLTYPEGDYRRLAQHLSLVMDDSSLRCELGRRGRERVLQHFTHAKVARDTVSFYKQVCLN